MSKRAVINLSTAKYNNGRERLRNSLINNTDADLMFYESESKVGSPLHIENPYAFKLYSFVKAIRFGYKSVLWLDASMVVIKNLNPLFEEIESSGHFMQDSGWKNERWTNENTKQKFGNDGIMFSAGVLGLNFENKTSQEFFVRWYKAMEQGYFKGSHDDHRHDQTLGSLIAHDLEMEITPKDTYWNYGKEPLHKDILILADGIV